MEQTALTNRQKQIVTLIKKGHCLPREIAYELKANKTNVSTALKFLLDNGFVVREKFYGTYVYALTTCELTELVKQKEKLYAKQMSFERDLFSKRRLIINVGIN